MSPQFIYHFDNVAGSVHFQLQFYRERIQDGIECSIFLKILEMPSNIEFVISEMDIICHCDDDVQRSLMRKQKILPHGTKKGITVFRSAKINANSLISWKVAIQMEPKCRITSTARNVKDLQTQHKEQQEEIDGKVNQLFVTIGSDVIHA